MTISASSANAPSAITFPQVAVRKKLKDVEGRVVTGHHDAALTYVGPDEPQDRSNVAVGLFGRSKRHRDGTELHVVHVEDKGDSASRLA
ncbi:hypothetical protein [Streptomyces sp. NPDC059371]|uniref:hypothetical protein n=1 Tax=Streptomyces sp. NPDC059371 TaxID=3346812 RepID=UPI0036C1F8EE